MSCSDLNDKDLIRLTDDLNRFINHKDSESILSDLKLLLLESRQRIPPFLDSVPTTTGGDGGESHEAQMSWD